MKFEKPSQNTRQNRNRKVICLKPPFCLNVTTNVGKEIFKLIRKHFPRNYNFRKIFNLNTIRISYSSMKNMKNLIKQHNARVLKNQEHSEKRSCNWREILHLWCNTYWWRTTLKVVKQHSLSVYLHNLQR